MYATDFEYDGFSLSDYGMCLCSFNSSGIETLSSGADISFHTVRPVGSDRFYFYGSKYEETYTAMLQICKNPCRKGTPYLTPEEVSTLQRWLCRKDGFHKLKFLSDNYIDIYWNAVFSSKQINFANQVVGLELTIYTDSPYAFREEHTIHYSLRPGETFTLYDVSDEIGIIYPYTTIISHSSGKIILKNEMENSSTATKVESVSQNEKITLDGKNKLITSSIPTRSDLPSKFNFHYPCICNDFQNRNNIFTLSADSVACDISFTYSPIVKVGI